MRGLGGVWPGWQGRARQLHMRPLVRAPQLRALVTLCHPAPACRWQPGVNPCRPGPWPPTPHSRPPSRLLAAALPPQVPWAGRHAAELHPPGQGDDTGCLHDVPPPRVADPRRAAAPKARRLCASRPEAQQLLGGCTWRWPAWLPRALAVRGCARAPVHGCVQEGRPPACPSAPRRAVGRAAGTAHPHLPGPATTASAPSSPCTSLSAAQRAGTAAKPALPCPSLADTVCMRLAAPSGGRARLVRQSLLGRLWLHPAGGLGQGRPAVSVQGVWGGGPAGWAEGGGRGTGRAPHGPGAAGARAQPAWGPS